MVTSLLGPESSLPYLNTVAENARIILLVPALLFLLLAALGAHAAAALLLHSPSKLARRLDDEGLAPLDDLRENAQEFQIAAWVSTLGGVVAAILLSQQALEGSLFIPILVGVLALFFCGTLPLSVGRRRAESTVIRTLPLLRVMRSLLRYPVVLPLMAITRWVLWILRIHEQPPTDPDEIADEIMAAVTDSVTEDTLHDEEKSWIENIVELKDRHVSEAMTPRTDIVAFAADMNLRDAVSRASEAGNSRYPVFEDSIDNVVGVFYAKDALPRLGRDDESLPIQELMRQPLFVPKSMHVVDLLERFKASKVQMAIVLDEYGGTAGLITIEDILEEIVGDISDEYDPDEEDPIKVIEEGRIIEISGMARVDEVNELLGNVIPDSNEYDTVAGYVFSSLGKIPKSGEIHSGDALEVHVLSADERRINRMRLTLKIVEPTDSKT